MAQKHDDFPVLDIRNGGTFDGEHDPKARPPSGPGPTLRPTVGRREQ